MIHFHELFSLVPVIARAGVKFGINFTSCSKNGYFAVIATMSENFTSASAITKASFANTLNTTPLKWRGFVYPIALRAILVTQQRNTLLKSDFQTCFMMSSGFFALLTLARHAVKVENRSGLTFFVHRAEANSLSRRVVAYSFPQASSSYCSRSYVRYVVKNRTDNKAF